MTTTSNDWICGGKDLKSSGAYTLRMVEEIIDSDASALGNTIPNFFEGFTNPQKSDPQKIAPPPQKAWFNKPFWPG